MQFVVVKHFLINVKTGARETHIKLISCQGKNPQYRSFFIDKRKLNIFFKKYFVNPLSAIHF